MEPDLFEVPLSATTLTHPPATRWTTAETARYLDVCTETVRILIRRDALPAHRIGRVYRFIPAEIDAWLAEQGPERAVRQPDSPDPYRDAVRKLVDQAPPLTAEQADRIAAILGGGR